MTSYCVSPDERMLKKTEEWRRSRNTGIWRSVERKNVYMRFNIDEKSDENSHIDTQARQSGIFIALAGSSLTSLIEHSASVSTIILRAAIVRQPEGVTLQKYPQTRLLLILVEEVV